MMNNWSFILTLISVNLILTNGELQFKQLKAKLITQTPKKPEEKVDEFGKILKDIEAPMDPTVDPCGNFYKFVCGRFSEKSQSPYDRAVEEIKKLIISKYEEKNPLVSEKKSSLIKHSRNLYKSCIKPRTKKTIDEFLLRDVEAIGGWPALKGNSWNKSVFDWKRLVFKAGNQVTWSDYLFNIRIKRDGSVTIVTFDYIGYIHEDALKFAVRLGGNNSMVIKELEKVKEFSENFLGMYNSHITTNIRPDQKMLTLQNLIDQYPYYPWLEHCRYYLPNIQLNDTLLVYRFDTIKKLHSLLRISDQRMLANIVAWGRLSDMNYTLESYHQSQKNPNSENCFELVSKFFPLAPSTLYLHEFVNNNQMNKTKELAHKISNKIRQQFIEMLEKTNWMNDRTYLLRKIQHMSYQFGCLFNNSEDNLSNKYYDKLQYNQSSFYETILSNIEFIRFAQLDEKFIQNNQKIKDCFSDVKDSSFAHYDKQFNSIYVKLALLQRQFIDTNSPMWMNYALFGAIIGHEFGQSLDPIYIQSNADGDIIHWPVASTSHIQYHSEIYCLNKMYREIGNLTTNPTFYGFALNTARDDVADNLGFKAAYRAYKNSSAKEKNRTLYKKEYSPDQLFWISATNRFCSRSQPLNKLSESKQESLIDEQNSNELRILASLSNNDGFARDFNCPAYSQMNGQQKCSIFQ